MEVDSQHSIFLVVQFRPYSTRALANTTRPHHHPNRVPRWAAIEKQEAVEGHSEQYRWYHEHVSAEELATPPPPGANPLLVAGHYYNLIGDFVHRRVVKTAWFEGFIMLCIVVMGVAVGMSLEGADAEGAPFATALAVVDDVTFWVFTLEFALKVGFTRSSFSCSVHKIRR